MWNFCVSFILVSRYLACSRSICDKYRWLQKGDLIFHGANQETYAISIAQSDCYEAEQPEELKNLNL